MSTKMLINAQRAQQVRVAIVADGILRDYQVEVAEKDLCRGNIYRGIVANIQPSLNAAFIDIGEERHGFLPVADVLASAYHKKPPKDARRPRIDQVLEKGKSVVVQVTKDGVGQKGPALTTNVALAGRYLVFTPFDDVRGISRKAEDDAARKTVRERLKKLNLPEGNGVIVRTNGLEQNQTTLNRDLNALVRLWKKINTEIGKGRGPRFLYSDQNLVVQALRDYLDKSISEVVVDEEEVFHQVEAYMRTFMPRTKIDLSLYQERLPVFSRHRLETQIDRIYERQAPLPSGGYLVIDNTEALTAIDVNSGRATRNSNHDESILNTNLESAVEVARQLRLRDIGGLVVVDFIDMRLRKHQHKLEKEMRDAMKDDKARYSVGRISPNGLLEINRQRIKQAIRLRTHRSCPTCDGVGTIASSEFGALNLLGRIESRVATGLVDRVTVALHPEIADTLQNDYRKRLAQLELELGLEIEIISAPGFGRLEERLDFHQREEGAAATTRSLPALTATDLTVGKSRRRSSPKDEVDESEETKPRRRRRSAPKDDVAESEETKPRRRRRSAPKDEVDETEETKPRRRRRRRRSGRAADEGDVQQDEQNTKQADDSQDDNAQETQDSEERPRRRRRRRRRPESQDDADNASRSDSALAGDKTSDETRAASEDAAESKPTRTRKRRTRRRPTGDADSTDAPSQEAAAPVEAAADSEKAPRTRRRRQRSSPKDESTAKASAKRDSGDSADDEAPKPARRGGRQARSSKDGDGDAKPAPRQRRQRSDSPRGRSTKSKSDAPPKERAPRTRRSRSQSGEIDDNIGNRSDAEPTHTTTTTASELSSNGAANRRRRPSRRRGGAPTKSSTPPPDVAKGDIILPEKLAGAHKPGSPPPKRTGTSVQKLRWQWWGGGEDKGGSSEPSSE